MRQERRKRERDRAKESERGRNYHTLKIQVSSAGTLWFLLTYASYRMTQSRSNIRTQSQADALRTERAPERGMAPGVT
jgi:hypothetical protein